MNTITSATTIETTWLCDEGCGATFPNQDANEQMVQVEKDGYLKLVCENCMSDLYWQGWSV